MKAGVKSSAVKGAEKYRFVIGRSKGAEFETDGLREEFAYRDLGLRVSAVGRCQDLRWRILAWACFNVSLKASISTGFCM